jgi:sugar lactone lactonase YvrE
MYVEVQRAAPRAWARATRRHPTTVNAWHCCTGSLGWKSGAWGWTGFVDPASPLGICRTPGRVAPNIFAEVHMLHRARFVVLGVSTLTGAALLASSCQTADPVQLQSQTGAVTSPSFLEFESGPVRPIALSPDGTHLFAVNTPNATLEIFNVTATGVTFAARVPVGLEPVAVAARGNTEAWVVNHLSDSVSVVTLTGTPHVTRTLLVGDEPRDIVFAGSSNLAFITTAHRGQQRTDPSISGVPGAGDPQLVTPSVPRADVWVFNPASLGNTVGGTPVKIMSFFTDTPRALAVSADRSTVYVAGFHTGNQTSIVNEEFICEGFDPNTPCTNSDGTTSPGGNLGPKTDASGEQAPEVSMIVKFNNATGHWQDPAGRVWDHAFRFKLPDTDVFAVDANGLTQKAAFAHVGTTLFNMVTNPATGELYVSNNEAQNLTRFEGPGIFGKSTVQGHLAESRVTIISGTTVNPRHLNKHIDYTKLAGRPGFDPTAKNHSLATPTDMVVSGDGKTLFVAAFGSSKIGVFDTTQLRNNTFDPRAISSNYIPVSGGGPSGLVLDEAHSRMFVATRFDNAIKVIDLATKAQTAALAMPNPEPASVVAGRPMLYDATHNSGNGEAACASCHTFGDLDDLAWDLGNPDEKVTSNPIPINLGNPLLVAAGKLQFGFPGQMNGTGNIKSFHPMKGPMTTQTLRGLVNSGAMHWRGDRANGQFGVDANDANLSFDNFIVAFPGLIGAEAPPPAADMQRFTDFQLQVVEPPNPVRALDNSLNSTQNAGKNFFAGSRRADGIDIPFVNDQTSFTCNGCHELDPAEGEFGTSKAASFEGIIAQIFKVPHLRNMYTKVGMFGNPKVNTFDAADTGFLGDQIRGFGFTNEGASPTIFHFVTAKVFHPQLNSGFPLINPDNTRRQVEQYLLAFDSDLAPITGQQVTLTSSNASAVGARITLLEQRANASFTSKLLGGAVKECELVARVAQNGTIRGFLFNPANSTFVPSGGGTALTDAQIRALASTAGQEVTFTAVPTGSGARLAAVQ